jgi:hypothetical protein
MVVFKKKEDLFVDRCGEKFMESEKRHRTNDGTIRGKIRERKQEEGIRGRRAGWQGEASLSHREE